MALRLQLQLGFGIGIARREPRHILLAALQFQ